ncbi:carboxypeptidase-like regulatory domain-containing protein [bacterium]|nr:carboxypeptidase-like regulatory domain-containing protein [bacterium]
MKRLLYIFIILGLFSAVWYGCKKKEEQPGAIYGVITDKATGEPVGVASVELRPNGVKKVTGNDGRYEFVDIEGGKYGLAVSKTGYMESDSCQIVVVSGQRIQRDILIEKIPQSLRIVGGDGKEIDTLDFGAEEDVDSRTFSIFNDGSIGITWWIDETCPWISYVKSIMSDSSSGKLEAGKQEPIKIGINRTALGQGRKSYILNINSDNGSKELTVMATGTTFAVSNVLSVANVTKNSAVFNGSVEDPGNPHYTERGFVYAETTNPTVNDTKISVQLTETKDFSARAEGLSAGKTYYVRTYMINNAGISYSSNEVKFSTITISTVVETKSVSGIDVSEKTAMLNGAITQKGIPSFSERGFMYSFQEDMAECTKLEETGDSEGNFSLKLSNIQLGTNYYVRAYAVQGGMYIYGNVVSFSGRIQESVLTTSAATNVSATSATLNASVSVVGAPAYTERGFCYSKAQDPTISDYCKKDDGLGTGAYSVEINDLDYKTTYYVRAYVLQEGKPIYGDCVSFTTIWTDAGLRTLAPTNVRSSSVTLNAEIYEIGSPQFTEKGFCYSKSHSKPTISDTRKAVKEDGGGIYSLDEHGLDYKTTYYVRAYLVQGGTPIYGDEVSLTTTWSNVEVRTFAATDIEAESAVLRGELVNPGDPVCTEYGFVYSTSRIEPIISDNKVVFTSIQTTYSSLLENLTENTTYYVRTYAVQNGKVFYGDVTQFQTGTIPRVETMEVDVYRMSKLSGGYLWASFQGNVLSVGNPEYVERGFVFAVEDILYNTPPTYENSLRTTIPSTGSGVYTSTSIKGQLRDYEWYVVRAYVKMRSGKIYYGGVVKFDTWRWTDLDKIL